MRKLIYKLYNENMISEEVVHILLDKLEEWQEENYINISYKQIGMD